MATTEIKNDRAVKAVATANTNFSTELIQALKKDFPKNLICSPFSLSAVIAMTHFGARGDTALQIARTFHFPENAVLGQGYKKLMASLQISAGGNQLATANKMYCKSGFDISNDYEKAVTESFFSQVEQLDFGKAQEAAEEINEWVEEQTAGKIKNLIQPEMLNSLTQLVLVNAIYFKGMWKTQFKPMATKKAPFFLNGINNVQVEMMNQTTQFLYGDFPDLGAHGICMPYRGDRLGMIILAPKAKTGLSAMEVSIRTEKYGPEKFLQKMNKRNKIAVRLPRFRIESTIPLNNVLIKMGADLMFNENRADFSGIPAEHDEQLFVSIVIQKAFVEVNEEGTEAAAATVIMNVKGKSSKPQPIPFDCDRPFIFQIVDLDTNFILFAGRVTNPKAN